MNDIKPLSLSKKRFTDAATALEKGAWVKLICGASNQDLPAIKDICAIFAAAGVHCVDIAADIAVANAALEGLCWAQSNYGANPWLMVSVSDGKDVRFRKANFNKDLCPKNCHRPCEKICPAAAISSEGINNQKCYGCGRCLPICPLGIINEEDHHLPLQNIGSLIEEINPDAIEIHTAPGRIKDFEKVIANIFKTNVKLKRIAVSIGIEGHALTAEALAKELWERHACLRDYGQKPLWQLDGRPMSGDIGISSAKSAVELWEKIRPIAPPGPLQLAGGTNAKTINYLSNGNGPEGVAFGGIARKLIQPLLIEAQENQLSITEWSEGWNRSIQLAEQLIQPWLIRQNSSKTC